MKTLVALGTRPEAVKLAPVILALRAKGIDTRVLFTGQHPEMALPVLNIFGITPDYLFTETLDSFALSDIAASYLRQAGAVLETLKPDLVLVQGDTTSAYAAALASYYHRCPVGHVEAGLRTNNPLSPFPEENHRRMIATLSSLHFAPSEMARQALLAEGIADEAITITGNTVIDALQWALQNAPDPFKADPDYLGGIARRPFILVTAHRRENFDGLHQAYFTALNHLAQDMPEISILYVTHPNPNVKSLAHKILIAPNIRFIDPVGYEQFVHLMQHAKLIVTDSGGIQEESAFLGKPTLVMRANTERKELLDQGNVIMAGTDGSKLRDEVKRLLTDDSYYQKLSRVTLAYGTGKASSQIVDMILQWHRKASH